MFSVDVELIKIILEDYRKEFKENPVTDPNKISFREGLIFAYTYLLVVLEDPNSIDLIYRNHKEDK